MADHDSKQPQDEVQHMLKSASPQYRESHLRATLKESLLDEGALDYMQVPMGKGTPGARQKSPTGVLSESPRGV